jgi:hypothetical protein
MRKFAVAFVAVALAIATAPTIPTVKSYQPIVTKVLAQGPPPTPTAAPSPTASPSPSPTPALYNFTVSGSFVIPYSSNQGQIATGVLALILNALNVSGVPNYSIKATSLATASPSP